MTITKKIVGVLAAAATVLTLGMTALTANAADGVGSDANAAANVKQSLQYLQQLNDLRARTDRTPLTPQQIIEAQNADNKANMKDGDVADNTADGSAVPALKVNNDLMKWAQTRANELAAAGNLDGHANMYNGAPSWYAHVANTDYNLTHSANYKGGYFFGPENQALSYPDRSDAHNPVTLWYSELSAQPGSSRQGYGHYLTEVSPLADIAGFGVAKVQSGAYAGATIAVLEIGNSYQGESVTGKNQTVDEALAALGGGQEPTQPSGDVAINETNFPDEHVRQTLSSYSYDPNQDGVLSKDELNNINYLYLDTVSSLKGLELLPKLSALNVYDGSFDSFDFASFPALTSLTLVNTGVTQLSVPATLQQLSVGGEQSIDLDLTQATGLTSLSISGWDKTTLPNLPNPQKLGDLSVREAKNLQSADLSSYTGLTSLALSGDTSLKSLKLNDKADLVRLLLYGVPADVNQLGLGKYTNLIILDLGGTNVNESTLASVKSSKLQQLGLGGTKITSLSKFTGTSRLVILGGNGIVDNQANGIVSGLTGSNISGVDLSDNDIRNITIPENTKFDSLSLNGNKLTSLNIPSSVAPRETGDYASSYMSLSGNPLLAVNANGNNKGLSLTAVAGYQASTQHPIVEGMGGVEETPQAIEAEPYTGTYDEATGSFDLKSVVPWIDASKISNVAGAKLDGTKLTGLTGEATVTYYYDMNLKPKNSNTGVIDHLKATLKLSPKSAPKDTVAPVLSGVKKDVSLTAGDTFDPKSGVTAADDVDGNLTSSIAIDLGGLVLNNGKVANSGVFTVTYTVADKAGNTATATTKVTVKTNTKALQAAVDAAAKLDQYQYTTDTWAAFAAALQSAQDTLANTAASQSDLDAAQAKLAQAQGALTKDTTAPVISGADNTAVDFGATFDPKAGVTATDDVSGDLTDSIVVTGAVNTTVAGQYTLTYTVSDKAGNKAEAERVITVSEKPDTTKPVFAGVEDASVKVGGTFDPKAGVTASDDKDGDLTASIVVTGTVDTNTVGDYTLTYAVSDKAGNTATVVRKVSVTASDTAALQKAVNAAADLQESDYAADGWAEFAAARKNAQDVLANKNATQSQVDKATARLTAAQKALKKLDKTKPVIKGADDVTIAVGDTFDPKAGVTASDDVDGDLTDAIVVSGSVDVTKDGVYELTYTVSDKSGNKTTVTRKITVKPSADALKQAVEDAGKLNENDYTADSWKTFADALAKAQAVLKKSDATQAEINDALKALNDAQSKLVKDVTKPEFAGVEDTEVAFGAAFDAKAGVTAKDDVSGDLTAKIVVTGSVDVNKAGVYEVTYTVSDKAGNTATAVRKVTVKAADRTGLDAAIAAAQMLDQYQYTKESWAALTKALGEAAKVNGNAQATQAAIDAASKKLADAQAALAKDEAKPLFSGVDDVTLNYGDSFDAKAGVLAWDEVSGNLSGAVTVAGAVDTKTAGTYELTYTVADKAGNTATVIRKVTVKSAKDGLQQAVDSANKLNKGDYTADSWKQFEQARDNASKVLSDPNSTEPERFAAQQQLDEAMGRLQKKTPSGNNTDNKGELSKGDSKKNQSKNPLTDTGSSVVYILLAVAVLVAAAVVLLVARRHRE
ncbi:immunoglobulin-like domain-containing protein [Bifidobacterium imperatoris]|uniref:Glycosyl hydrolase family 32 n=1 Tax=Bifidobacterium imperatoris TaxID=2020965 RepID=A0A2N5IPZ5_9BIFI|nr:immunoglobulin-like domain-containing protein [Bifidobacterium imperatoris]PLS24038.1 glycosyl hydrolase family 32 [Bifidobacterium imperatoris]